MRLVLYLLVVLFCGACTNGKYEKMEHLLERDTMIVELSDSTFIYQNVPFIDCCSDEVFFSDYQNGCLVVLDHSLNFKYRIGKQGEGPEELIGALMAYKDGTNYFISDDGSRAIKMYSHRGNYLRTIKFPVELACAVWNRFVYKDSLFYLPCIQDSLMAVVDMHGQIVKKIGACAQDEFGGRILLSDNTGIWAIGQMTSIIEKYSYDGLVQLSEEYNDVPCVKEWSDKNKKENKLLVNDACIDGDDLYLLLTRRVLHFSLLDNTLELKSIFMLPHGFYSRFSVSKDKMYCFNARDVSIERFSLNF